MTTQTKEQINEYLFYIILMLLCSLPGFYLGVAWGLI